MLLLGIVLVITGFSHSESAEANIVYKSKLPYGETYIPYHNHFGRPTINVVWNGRKTECFVDTGSSGIVSFAAMKLPGEDIGEGRKQRWAGGRSFTSRLNRTNLELGGITIQGAISQCVGDPTMALKDLPSELPLLGTAFLKNFCVTFNPEKSLIVLRRPEYKPDLRGAFILNMRPEGGLPWVYGKFNGKVARFLIDTGWTDGYAFNSSSGTKFFKSIPQYKKTLKGVANSSDIPARYSYQVGPIKGRGRLLPFCSLASKSDMLVGWPLLSKYEATFDYRQGRLILRPIKEKMSRPKY